MPKNLYPARLTRDPMYRYRRQYEEPTEQIPLTKEIIKKRNKKNSNIGIIVEIVFLVFVIGLGAYFMKTIFDSGDKNIKDIALVSGVCGVIAICLIISIILTIKNRKKIGTDDFLLVEDRILNKYMRREKNSDYFYFYLIGAKTDVRKNSTNKAEVRKFTVNYGQWRDSRIGDKLWVLQTRTKNGKNKNQTIFPECAYEPDDELYPNIIELTKKDMKEIEYKLRNQIELIALEKDTIGEISGFTHVSKKFERKTSNPLLDIATNFVVNQDDHTLTKSDINPAYQYMFDEAQNRHDGQSKMEMVKNYISHGKEMYNEYINDNDNENDIEEFDEDAATGILSEKPKTEKSVRRNESVYDTDIDDTDINETDYEYDSKETNLYKENYNEDNKSTNAETIDYSKPKTLEDALKNFDNMQTSQSKKSQNTTPQQSQPQFEINTQKENYLTQETQMNENSFEVKSKPKKKFNPSRWG